MVEKYGIFLVNGTILGYGGIPTIEISKLKVGDFDTIEQAAAYIRAHPISIQHFIGMFVNGEKY